MPITLTLTDDQALDIVRQIGVALSGTTPVPAPPLHAPPKSLQVEEYVKSLNKGTIFRNVELQHNLKITVEPISRALSGMQKNGLVKMLQRGTWQKL